MLYAQGVELPNDVAYPLTPPLLFSSNKAISRKSKELWTKGPKWNNAANEKKEKYHYFTHSAHDYTNSLCGAYITIYHMFWKLKI